MNELSEQLHKIAASVNPRGDLVEVELGAGRVRSRRRVATGVVATMLVAGAGGAGFGIGRSVADDGDRIAAGAVADDDSADGADDVAAATPSPTDDPTTVLPPVATPAEVGQGSSGTTSRAGATVAADEAAGEGGYYEYEDSYYVDQPLTVVYERVLDDGLRVRVQRGEPWQSEPYYGSNWTPALFCWPTAPARVTIDGDDLVDVGGSGWYEELFNGLAVQPFDVGHADGHPMRLLQIQAASDVTHVAVTWPDGVSDNAELLNGVAVLVVDGSYAYGEYTLEVTDATGTRTLTNRDLEYYDDAEYRAGCEEPPPALPEAGEQPGDPDAARAEILERFELLWDRSVPSDDKPADLIDDDEGVDAAVAAIVEGVFAESAETAEHVMEEFVFTSPTEAWFRYGIDTSTGYYGQRYGYVTLIDGAWVFPRELICQDLALAGSGCEPWPEAIFPPSWYERYGGPHEECWIDESGTEICELYGDEAYAELVEVPANSVLVGD
jgi:hypothetical protein